MFQDGFDIQTMHAILINQTPNSKELLDAFVSALQTARCRLEKDDDMKRKVVRFSLNLMHDFLKNLSSSSLPSENSAEVAWRTKGALTETDIPNEAQIPTKIDSNSRRFN